MCVRMVELSDPLERGKWRLWVELMSLLFFKKCLLYQPGDRLLLIRNFVLCGEVAVPLIESGYIFFVGK